MAASHIEEKILGRLAKQTAPTNPLLSSSLYQVLGLSILLSRKLNRARRVRRLDITRDTKSLQLYHQIIWLAREGLSITEVYILPHCQDGDQIPECRVMAAKLRASFYHVFCLFHNHPPISTISSRSPDSTSSPRPPRTPISRVSPGKSPQDGTGRRRARKSSLRDPIPSMTSEVSYVTNPYAVPAQTPPPPGPPPPIPSEANRRTPTHPPGLAPINIPSPRAAASFLLPPLNFIPLTRSHFENAQYLSNNLLYPAHALRLSVALEFTAFKWDCEKDHERARRLARRAIKEVYTSTDPLDDEEFDDAADLVNILAGIMKRGGGGRSGDSTKQSPPEHVQTSSSVETPLTASTGSPRQRLRIDRTIPVSPSPHQAVSLSRNLSRNSPLQRGSNQRSPALDRLSTVPEIDPSTDGFPRTSTETTNTTNTRTTKPPAPTPPTPPSAHGYTPPPLSRLSNQPSQTDPRDRRPSGTSLRSPTTSEKALKRHLAEQAERDFYRRGNTSSATSSTAANASIKNQTQTDIPAPLVVSLPTGIGPLRMNEPRTAHVYGTMSPPDSTAHSRQTTPTDGYVRTVLPDPRSVKVRHDGGKGGVGRGPAFTVTPEEYVIQTVPSVPREEGV
ncbi:Hypothetical protein R9X50_00203100 [Acrodontium crateriforme]|uniref:14-3-3 domain-containing protein n=1 Tax=Acrodontium crateriforme TaxID=150365 RepID=A0AAQ3R895_9PEZI|nr:Hypothetical protein R9X50_00203100 [Acrodontium crateriforme]